MEVTHSTTNTTVVVIMAVVVEKYFLNMLPIIGFKSGRAPQGNRSRPSATVSGMVVFLP